MSITFLMAVVGSMAFYIDRSQASSIANSNALAGPAFVDSGFNPVIGGPNGQMVDSYVLPDGKVLIAGKFEVINGTNKNQLARFNADGTLDTTFNVGAGPNDAVFSIDRQSDGKIIISGLFTSYNTVPVGRIARLNADGSLDQTFNTSGVGMNSRAGGNNEITKVKVLPNDKIMVGGAFTNFNGTTQNRLARLNADGSIDTSFTIGTGANNTVIAIAQQSDGKFLIGGNFTQYNGTLSPRMARINSDGTLDTSFIVGNGADQSVMSIIEQPDKKILVSGFFISFSGAPKNGITRLTENGANDPTFSVAGQDAVVMSTALQPDGKIMVGGSFGEIAGAVRKSLARLNADGTNDETFTSGTGIGAQVINKVTLRPDGKAVISGSFATYNGTANGGAIRINADGSHEMNLASSSAMVGNFYGLSPQTDGKIIVGGSFATVDGVARANIARLNANGTNDPTFNPGTGANSPVYATVVQPDGKIVIGGNFTMYNGVTVNRIVRVNTDGSIDSSFATGTAMNGAVESLALQPDGKILVGGGFTTFNGATVNRFMRLNMDGTADSSFVTGTSINGVPKVIAIQPDGKVVIGGQFTTYNGTSRNRVARVNVDGSLDTSFDPGTGAANIVNSLAVQADGKIVIGGSFISVNGIAKAKIARLNANGSVDTTFDSGTGPGPGTAAEVTKVLAVENGKLLVAGNFTTFSGSAKTRILRLNSNGSVDHTFLSGNGAIAGSAGLTIRSLVRQPNGMILIGGQFSIFNVSARSGLARLSNSTDTYADLDGDGKTDFAVMRRANPSSPWEWWVNQSSNGATEAFEFGMSSTDIAQPADYDGDGRDDVAVWRGGDACAYHIIQSSTNTVRIIPFGLAGDVPMTEDYDGDGRDDLSVWRAPSSSVGQATWYYLGSSNNGNNNITFVPFGMRYGTGADQVDKPSTGDFDGDGKADFRVHRRANIAEPSADSSAIIYTMTATGGVTQDYFGWASDKVVPGDYDGDGRTDIAVVRGHNGTQTIWYIRYANGQPDSAIHWGAGSVDLLSQGDYDGDGITDLAVYRRGEANTFYVRRSSDQSMMALNFGATSSDFPVANYNNR